MELRQVTPRYFVSPQISPEDVATLKDAGFTHVICNRPDEEIPASHHADVIGAAAEAAGLIFVVNPLTHQTMTPDRMALQRLLRRVTFPETTCKTAPKKKRLGSHPPCIFCRRPLVVLYQILQYLSHSL